MKREYYYLLAIIVLSIITSFVRPHGDDFLFINYLDNCGLGEMHWHKWANDCILLPRGFWRPIMDLFAYYVLTIYPLAYFIVMHVLSVFCHVGSAYMVYYLCRRLQCRDSSSFIASVFFLFCTTCMGGLIPGDGLAQVSTTFWGLLSVCCYISKSKLRYVGWIIFAVIAMFWKDGGFVWLPVAPIFNEILEQKDNYGVFVSRRVRWARLLSKLFISFIPIAFFLIVYLSFKPDLVSGVLSAEANDSTSSFSKMLSVDQDNSSHTLTPANFVKSFFVLYIAGLFPIDTSAIYGHNWILLSITLVLSVFASFFILKLVSKYIKTDPQEFCGFLLLVLLVSSIALITRAGEISPHPSNAIIAIIFGLAMNKLDMSKAVAFAIVAFVLSTAITDAHKFYLSYTAGKKTCLLAREVKSKTHGNPEKVLSISVGNHKGEGAFVINTPNDYRNGVAVIHEYGWKCPKYFDPIRFYDDEDNLDAKIEDIINKNIGKDYDCIWVQKPSGVEVINIKQ